MSESGIGTVLEEARSNAAVAWALVGIALVAAVANGLAVAPLWAGFALAVVALALVPPLKYRDPTAMLPWEVLALATLPLVARVMVELAALRGDVVTYVAVAAVALVVAVELHLLTPVEMNERFAVGFVVVTTMAAAGLWAVLRYGSDILLGTTLLLPPGGAGASEAALAAAERDLMLEFVASFLAGVGAGALFEFYFRRRHRGEAVMDAMEEVAP
ncbi:hypothetical protein [Halosegnis marinus]|uniref:Uncharacterized protein n=1 Tax=Halosegnis marinus TaxID=3034023 RepID=A0ABD5ZLA7_9EURY|nr:hypothetical protein [Halosegnis sp. DT85]